MLEGKEICVVNGPASHPKAALEKTIIEFGGTIAQNPGISNSAVFASAQLLCFVFLSLDGPFQIAV